MPLSPSAKKWSLASWYICCTSETCSAFLKVNKTCKKFTIAADAQNVSLLLLNKVKSILKNCLTLVSVH
jgi:hypothetical protein